MPRFRPRFSIPLSVPPAALVDSVRQAVQQRQAPVTGIVLQHQIELRLPESEQRLFTPVLNINVLDDAHAPSGHALVARFAPHPHIWMLVIAIYFGVAFVAIAGAIWASAQWLLGGSLLALWWIPASLAFGGFVHGAVIIGQGLSADQMHVLRGFIERVVEDTTRALEHEG